MSARLSLAEQIAQLQDAAPADFDPEYAFDAPEPDEIQPEEETNAREHYLDVGPSTLRRLQSVADPKYEGIKTSRRQLMEDSEEEPSDAEREDLANESDAGSIHNEDHENESLGEGAQDSEEEEESGFPPPDEPEQVDRRLSSKPPDAPTEQGEDLSSTLRNAREDDRKKGKAVSQQISIWETLLDARIRLQKLVTVSNQLPSSTLLSQFAEIPECREPLHNMLQESFLLSDEIFDLQENLFGADESIAPPPRKRRRLQSDATSSDFSTKLHEATNAASALEHAYHPYLVQTLAKWSSKIQAVAPSVLLPSNRNAFSSRNSQNLKSAVQLIDETLVDHRKLTERTQVRRGKGAQLGETAVTEDEEDRVDVEVFDDTDFYQQLLRDIIDSRGNNGPGSNDWMVAQKQKKAKKKVDTKASKGRKLRYEVHEKLQNFMVPVPVPGMWHEEQIDELFSSLMGAGFEGALGIEETVDEPLLNDVLKGGFKVFG